MANSEALNRISDWKLVLSAGLLNFANDLFTF
jgi:hypothetical protein